MNELLEKKYKELLEKTFYEYKNSSFDADKNDVDFMNIVAQRVLHYHNVVVNTSNIAEFTAELLVIGEIKKGKSFEKELDDLLKISE